MHSKDTSAIRGSQARTWRPNAQADAAASKRLKFAWLAEVNLLLRGEAGRLACKTQKVSHRLVADLAEELARYPSFVRDAEVWVGQAKLAVRLDVHERQVRRGVAVLVKLGVLRIERASRGQRRDTNTMAARLNERPLFEASELCYGASTSAEDRTSASPGYRVSAPSNLNEEEGKKDSSPVDPSEIEQFAPQGAPLEEVIKTYTGTVNRAQFPNDGVTPSGPTNPPNINEIASALPIEANFTILMRLYPHADGQRHRAAYEPHALANWRELSAAEKVDAVRAAPKAPGNVWVGHWLDRGRERGEFEVVDRQAATHRVWVREGTPQWNAWEGHYRAEGRRPQKTQRTFEGEKQTGWMFESEWPSSVIPAPSAEVCDG
jgi:hypothetical protein